MEHLLDVIITQAYQAKKKDGSLVEGEGEYGSWRLYNFYTDKTGDKKFGFMWGAKKPIPCKGLKVKHLEYEVQVDGEYTNYNVKAIEVDPDTPPMEIESQQPQSKPQANGNSNAGPLSMYVAYMKDIAVAILANGGNLETADLDAVARKIGRAGAILQQEGMNGSEIPPEKPKMEPTSNEKEKPEGNPSPREETTKIFCEHHKKEVVRRACDTCELRKGCPSHE